MYCALVSNDLLRMGKVSREAKRGSSGHNNYESFIYKSSSFKVSLPQCAQDSIAWESYVIMYINDINLSTSTFRRPGYPI